MEPKEISDLIKQSRCSQVVGLIGENPSTYSKSRIMWNAAFYFHGLDAEYIPFDVAPERLEDVLDVLLRNPKVMGFNVTNPYKGEMAKLLFCHLDESARVIEGANTIYKADGNVRGSSTDGYGATRSIEERCGEGVFNGSSVLVIGAGGAGSAIALACAARGGLVTVANRSVDKALSLADRALKHIHKAMTPVKLYQVDPAANGGEAVYTPEFTEQLRESDIVINSIDVEKKTKKPLFMGWELAAGARKICMDASYGHHSFFLESAKKEGHVAIDGEWMLLHQAVRAFEHMYAREIAKYGITRRQVEAPMRYALANFKFDAPNELIREQVDRAKGEIFHST